MDEPNIDARFHFSILLQPVASRRTERSPASETATVEFNTWRGPRLQAAGWMTAIVAVGFGIGFALDQTLIGTLAGVIVGSGILALIISRAPQEARKGLPRLSETLFIYLK